MQLLEVVSRKVVKVHEPAGKGPVVDGDEVVAGDAADEELQVRVNGMDAEVRDFDPCVSDGYVLAGFLAQTYCEADDKGYDACDDNEGNETYSLPPPSSRYVGIISQVLKLLSFWPGYIP